VKLEVSNARKARVALVLRTSSESSCPRSEMMLLMTSPRALSKRPFMNEGGLLGATIVQKNIS
jgi:hypothetical protein